MYVYLRARVRAGSLCVFVGHDVMFMTVVVAGSGGILIICVSMSLLFFP